MRSRIFLLGMIGVLLILTGIYFFFVDKKNENVAEQSNEVVVSYVPEFSFPDASGAQVVLRDMEAQLRVVNFWASWSPYSTDELRALVQLKKEYGDVIDIVALNRDTNSADGVMFLESLTLGDVLLFAYDEGDTYFKKVGGYNMPETLFVGEDGEVLAHIHGPMTYEAMRIQVEKLIE